MKKIKSIKQKAWEFYNAWRQGKTYSPAFQSDVKISLRGWRHITGATGHKKRNFQDTYRRLKLLPYAKEIIEKSSTIQNITIKGINTFYALEAKEKEEMSARCLTLWFVNVSVMESKTLSSHEQIIYEIT